MGPAVRACQRHAGAAAARRVQHQRKRHRRPVDRHGRRSAEHPLRRRDGDQQGGATRSSIAWRPRIAWRWPASAPAPRPRTFTADRARIKQALARMVGQKQAGRTIDVGHNIALVEAQAIEKGDRGVLESVQNRECMNARELARRPGDVPRAGRDRGALAGVRRQPRRRPDDSDAPRSLLPACG